MHDAFRHNLLLAAILFTILATGIALLWRKRAALVALVGLVVITMIALHAWQTRQSEPSGPVPSVTFPTD